MKRVLILAGTPEAHALAGALMDVPGVRPVASLAGATSNPRPMPCPVRTGGFGGVEGLMSWIRRNMPTALIDATHPFATQMQTNAFEACMSMDLPHLRLERPPWHIDPPRFRMPDLESAARHLPPGAIVLLTTGRKNLEPFIARDDVAFVLRTIEPVQGLPEHIVPMTAQPPFSLEDEIGLLKRLGATHVIAKNSGGPGEAKLFAAEQLRLTAMVVDRPPRLPIPIVRTVPKAVEWLHQSVVLARRERDMR